MRFVFLGPPGAGKGTHAKILSEKYGLDHLAAGDCLRRHIRGNTELGLKAKSFIEKGSLVPDPLVNEMIFFEIRRAQGKKGFILDGYPRTVGQAEAFDVFLTDSKTKLDRVINFAASEEVVIGRLSGRRVCQQCGMNYHVTNIPPKREGICDTCNVALVQRKDDQPETIRHRLEVYRTETSPLIDFYARKGLLYDISADKNVAQLQAELTLLFDKIQAVGA